MPPSEPAHLVDFRTNGAKIGRIRDQLAAFAQTHFRLEDIEAHACDLIHQAGGEPAFKLVSGYHWATCISVNQDIVHGIPKGYLKPHDLVTIDVGMYYRETTTDTATSFTIGEPAPTQAHFLQVGRHTLVKAIRRARVGAPVRDIAATIQKHIEEAGFSVVRSLTGHGLGKSMHELPQIPCFVSSDPALRYRLQPYQVLAIEVMYMRGSWPLTTAADGWTMSTADGSDSAVFEEDVLVTPAGPEVITATSLLEPGKKV